MSLGAILGQTPTEGTSIEIGSYVGNANANQEITRSIVCKQKPKIIMITNDISAAPGQDSSDNSISRGNLCFFCDCLPNVDPTTVAEQFPNIPVQTKYWSGGRVSETEGFVAAWYDNSSETLFWHGVGNYASIVQYNSNGVTYRYYIFY